jgi:chemotaxis signal transduction protein
VSEPAVPASEATARSQGAESAASVARDPDRFEIQTAAEAPAVDYFVIRLGNSLYALPGTIVDQVAPAATPVRVPGSPPHILGVVQLRDRILAVVDAYAILGAARSASPTASDDTPPRLLAVTVGQSPFAILADAVLGVHAVPATSMIGSSQARDAQSSFVAGRFELPGGVVTLLEPEALLAAIVGH